MLSKAVVHSGVRWLSPVSVHHVSRSHASRRTSVNFGNSTTKRAHGLCIENTFFTANTQPLWAASSPGEAFQKQSSEWRAVRFEEHGLQRIAGIGPRNEQRLVSAGIPSMQRLRAVFNEGCNGDKYRMLKFLQGKIGVRNRCHCSRIVSHLASTRSQFHTHNRQKITLCVEGNISSGKSTFLHELREGSLELKENVEVVPEPVDKWQKVQASNGSTSVNLLDAFYRDPQRFAYTFQNYVFLTRLVQAKESADCGASLRLMERSIFSDRMVFVRAAHEAKWLSEMELSIYESWFDPVLSSFEGLVPDGFIYLAASPETCLRRLTLRGRDEEGGVSLQYLYNLHAKHEEWLHTGMSRNGEIGRSSDPNRLEDEPVSDRPNNKPGVFPYTAFREPESIKGRVFYLSQEKQPLLSKHLDGLPALYLDCDEDIDLERDQAAQNTTARHVQDFANHVRVLREARCYAGLRDSQAIADEVTAPISRNSGCTSLTNDHTLLKSLRHSGQHTDL